MSNSKAELTWVFFRIVMTGTLGLGAWVIYRRLTRALPHSVYWKWGVRSGLAVFFLTQFLSPGFSRTSDPSVLGFPKNLLFWTGYTSLGFFGTLAVSLLLLELGTGLFSGWGWIKRRLRPSSLDAELAPETSLSRRSFLTSTAPLAITAGSVVSTGSGLVSAMNPPRVKLTQVPASAKNPALKGLKIAQISDLHIGQTINREYAQAVVDATLAAQPDLIVLTGDMIDGYAEVLREWTAPLRQLTARHGVFYIPGNHEYYWGLDSWLEEFRSMGFEVLDNRHRLIELEGARLLVSGITDHQALRMPVGPSPDARAATLNAPEHDFHLFLSHQPKGYLDADSIRESCPVDLMLSGHTHSGQFLPFAVFLPFVHRYWRGLNRHEDRMWVHVNPGTGYWGPPNRFGIPSEISLIELT